MSEQPTKPEPCRQHLSVNHSLGLCMLPKGHAQRCAHDDELPVMDVFTPCDSPACPYPECGDGGDPQG